MVRVRVGMAIAFLFSLAVMAEAQSTLNFPRQLAATELSTTGFALVNTSANAVTANFRFYGSDGLLITQSAQSVPAKGQLARLGSEIFPSATVAGWVQVSSSSTELQGFEIVGNFATVVDGAGPAPEGKQLALIDFSREDTLHIVNASGQAGTVQVTLNDAAGQTLGTKSIPLSPFQPASLRLGDVNTDNNIDLVTLTADVNISAALTTKLPGGLDIGLTNATLTAGAPSTLFFPFAPNGPQGTSNWTTYLGISNLATAQQTVTLSFTPDTGSAVIVQRTLAPGASVGDTVANLFGTSSTAFTAGWIRVTGTGGLAGVAAYQDSANGSLAIVPSQSAGSAAFFFGHIASLSPWYTGIALLNTSTTTANVEVYAIDSDGKAIGSAATFTLAPGRRTSLLSEFVPEVTQRSSDGGWVFVRTTNNVPLLGFELFGHAISPILANVQGFALASNSTFTPPVAAPTVDLVTTGDTSGNKKTQFAPRDTILYVATVTNPGDKPISVQVTFAVTDPGNQTLFSQSITGAASPGTGVVGLTSFIPSNALNGQYTFTATATFQGVSSSKSASFTVSGGTTTPSISQEPSATYSTSDVRQASFRPGDTVRFSIATSNFTNTPQTAVLNYQLTGPGSFNAGSGSLTYTVPVGLSFKTVDRVIPDSAQQGLFSFTPVLTVGGTTFSRGTVITVVPKSASESIDMDIVFAADSNGVPRAGFTPGSNIRVNARQVSTFGVAIPGKQRHTITAPGGGVVFDTEISGMIVNGGTISSIPVSIAADAVAGTYTYKSTVTYQDNSNTEKTSSLSTTFEVGANPPTLSPTLTTQRVYVTDINFIARTSFSQGESFALTRSNFSSFPASVAGTASYQLTNGTATVFNSTLNVTFNPGLNSSFIALTGSLQPGTTLTFSLTATAAGVSPATNSTNFSITGPEAPALPSPLTSPIENQAPFDWKFQKDASIAMQKEY